jgi:ubiquinone/menaquinone biosynthesis C-methylase UbiE
MPLSIPEYDTLAEIYDLWASVDPAYQASHDFYGTLCLETEGAIVELGVGSGRIAVDVARAGKTVLGVDISAAMLEKCRQNASRAGFGDRIQCFQGDMQDFQFGHPVQLVLIPFRSIGHLLTIENKYQALQNIYKQLVPGGRLVFDHYLFQEDWAREHNGFQRLMVSRRISEEQNLYIWDTYHYSFSTQQIAGLITVEKSNPQGQVISRAHFPIHESWITPAQVRHLATLAGFEVEAAYGDFLGHELADSSSDQVWVLRKPLAAL